MNPECPYPFEPPLVWCCICRQPVALEISKANEHGEAVHEECYVKAVAVNGQPVDIVLRTKSTSQVDSLCFDKATVFTTRVRHDSRHMPGWSTDAAAVIILAIIAWFTYSGHGPAAALKTASAFEESEVASVTAKARPAEAAFRRIRVGRNEIDDVREDVTIRHFTNEPQTAGTQVDYNEVKLGDDVTVRYFASDPRPFSGLGPSKKLTSFPR
jgi:hypothetical protein